MANKKEHLTSLDVGALAMIAIFVVSILAGVFSEF